MLYFAVVALLGVLSLGDAKWAYTEVATADGQPCLVDCKNGECLVNVSGTMKTCINSGVKAPTFSTAQHYDIKRTHCWSNCGLFGYTYEWCLTSEELDWDYCNSSPEDRTNSMIKCEGPCTKNENHTYTCIVENNYQPCAPPATTNEPNVDANKENLGIQKVGNSCTCSCTCSLPETNP